MDKTLSAWKVLLPFQLKFVDLVAGMNKEFESSFWYTGDSKFFCQNESRCTGDHAIARTRQHCCPVLIGLLRWLALCALFLLSVCLSLVRSGLGHTSDGFMILVYPSITWAHLSTYWTSRTGTLAVHQISDSTRETGRWGRLLSAWRCGRSWCRDRRSVRWWKSAQWWQRPGYGEGQTEAEKGVWVTQEVADISISNYYTRCVRGLPSLLVCLADALRFTLWAAIAESKGMKRLRNVSLRRVIMLRLIVTSSDEYVNIMADAAPRVTVTP